MHDGPLLLPRCLPLSRNHCFESHLVFRKSMDEKQFGGGFVRCMHGVHYGSSAVEPSVAKDFLDSDEHTLLCGDVPAASIFDSGHECCDVVLVWGVDFLCGVP